MIGRDSFLMVLTLYYFVCFHVTADLNIQEKETYAKPDKEKRDNFQMPLLNEPAPAFSGDWIADIGWAAGLRLGQVAGVTVNEHGEVLLFHRGDHVWNAQTFDYQNVYLQKEAGPIAEPTVLVINPQTGALVQKWGENMFYMPHGISLDKEGNLWLTDVALHQVFKFPPLSNNARSPLLTLGKPFVPGFSAVRFCKPTSVAVTPWGDFFVADGYCNSRLVKFNKDGEKILEIGHQTFTFGLTMASPYSFNLPHALTLAEDRQLVCLADRQNGRVLCFHWNNGTVAFHIASPQIGALIYSVSYTPLEGGLFFLVNGKEPRYNAPLVQVFVVSATNRRLLKSFGSRLQMPHDLAVSPDARHVYVAEIGPNVIHKYSNNGSLSPAAVTTPAPKIPQLPISPASLQTQGLQLQSHQGSVLPAVLVTSAAVMFGAAIVTAALVYSRARHRGCGHCSSRWTLGRSPAEGFMIGSLLGQHQGFEKLSTADDSEEEITTLQPFA